jgi:hypothetical protein
MFATDQNQIVAPKCVHNVALPTSIAPAVAAADAPVLEGAVLPPYIYIYIYIYTVVLGNGASCHSFVHAIS